MNSSGSRFYLLLLPWLSVAHLSSVTVPYFISGCREVMCCHWCCEFPCDVHKFRFLGFLNLVWCKLCSLYPQSSDKFPAISPWNIPPSLSHFFCDIHRICLTFPVSFHTLPSVSQTVLRFSSRWAVCILLSPVLCFLLCLVFFSLCFKCP